MHKNRIFYLLTFSLLCPALGSTNYLTPRTGQNLEAKENEKVLFQSNLFTVYADRVEQQGIFCGRALNDGEIRSNYLQGRNCETPADREKAKPDAMVWMQKKERTLYPVYSAPNQIERTLYNLSIEEMLNAVEPDNTLRTGKLWKGVWTRDVSYSIILSMAHLQPQVSMNSLMRKVNKNGRIIQDTGTGGAWPVSSDRMIWATAAWQIYKVTGNREWLEKCYPIIKSSVEDDILNVYDPATGLMKGESSFLDWREQTYPIWMQSADIYESKCLGTNAAHYSALNVLQKMAEQLDKKEEANRYGKKASQLKKAINHYLWMPEKGYYAQYLYGRNYQLPSKRSEALGEALCILMDIASTKQQQQMARQVPVGEFGIPCIYPQIPEMFSYHNNAVWPFVESYWMWAGAKAGNEASVLHSIASIYRAAALFATNKENFVAATGDYKTRLNSSNMLWSLSGNLSIVYRIFFGIHFEEEGLHFQPFVPEVFNGPRSLSNFKYRNMTLDIEMEGYGSKISHFILDGKKTKEPFISAALKGRHTLKIVLDQEPFKKQPIHLTPHTCSLKMPAANYQSGKLTWNAIEGAASYQLWKNGKRWKSTTDLSVELPAKESGEWMVQAVDEKGEESFASEPVNLQNLQSATLYQVEEVLPPSTLPYQGFTGQGFVEISKTVHQKVSLPIEIKKKGRYVIDWKYANGNGPTYSKNSCAIRTLQVDEKRVGISLFPQRGTKEWNNWGFSNGVQVNLTPGTHTVTLEFLPENENMNLKVNQAMIDYLRVAPAK